jgi:hypothetical protein
MRISNWQKFQSGATLTQIVAEYTVENVSNNNATHRKNIILLNIQGSPQELKPMGGIGLKNIF